MNVTVSQEPRNIAMRMEVLRLADGDIEKARKLWAWVQVGDLPIEPPGVIPKEKFSVGSRPAFP